MNETSTSPGPMTDANQEELAGGAALEAARREKLRKLKEMGVDPKERGYSARTIQREISAILEEC